jgi:hypothetical protein
VHHRTVFGAPGKVDFKLFTFGNSRKPACYNSPDCPVYIGQCPVLQEVAAPNSAASGIHFGCSAIIHRTCPVYTGLSGVTTDQRLLRRQRSPASAFNARRSQARVAWRTGHFTVHVRCATGHPGGPSSQSSNGQNPNDRVTWLAHRTCSVCTGLSGAPCDRQPSPTARFWLVAINTTPTGHFKVWEPKQHSKSYS